MWPFRKKKLKHRRLEVRKDISADSPTLWERFRTSGGPVSLLLGLGFWFAALLLDICPLDPLPYRQGQYLPGDIRARVSFEVPSRTRDYEAGEILAGRTGPSGLEAGKWELLAHEHRAWLAQESIAGLWTRAAGRAIQILMVTVLLCGYIARYQGRIVENHLRGLTVVVVLLVMLAISRIMVSALGWNPHSAVLTVVMISCVMAITYNQRFAMAIGSVLAILVTLQLRGDFGMLIVMFAGVMPCVFMLREVRTRSKLIEVSAISAAIVFLAVWARSLAGQTPWLFALVDGLWAAGFALLAGFLVQGVLPLIERAFKVATSMTLLEWCDASRPLLRRLATQAPGTYNHSLQLGAMCESASEAIGARGLLARVGAYYHDIGKTRKPEYFVENQGTMPSKHENLSPAMSLLIIVGHVKDGIEMAKECNLPAVLHEFIATHHGTTLVHHFYEEAARQRASEADRAPDEVEFRYPGPKPHSKEAGILMLADVAESSVRSMEDPTPGRIESQVHSMVQRRLMDGQLDHCNLTLREVHAIETSLIKSLCGIYHARIAYPTPSGEKPAAAERPSPNGRNGNGNGRKNGGDKPGVTASAAHCTDQSVSQDADS